jgi:hypothetical protein
MPAFRYQGMDGTGRTVEGTIKAESQSDARSRLCEEGLFVTEVAELPAEAVPPRPAPSSLGVDESDSQSTRDPTGGVVDKLERSPDLRTDFQTRLRRTTDQRRRIGCQLAIGIAATTILMVYFWPASVAWYWSVVMIAVMITVGSILVGRLYPPLPNCPNCGLNFERIGLYCPDCGNELPPDATPKQAYCPHCQYLVEIISKRPMAKQYSSARMYWRNVTNRGGISRYPHPKKGPYMLKEYKYVPVPLRYCTHCREKLTDE